MGIPQEIINDLASRFLVNLPDDQKADPIRLCFQLELAHWFYIDFYCSDEQRYPSCKTIGVREFIRTMFNHCDFLSAFQPFVDGIVNEWRNYKATVPTFGAILLDQSLQHVLLVQGWYAKHSWGFPKGKVNEDEDEMHCAVRETREETGFDATGMVSARRSLFQRVSDTDIRLFIVTGVPFDYAFEPQTRNEIRNIKWFQISDLPANRNDKSGLLPNNFFTVVPFVEPLRKWIGKHQRRRDARGSTSTVAVNNHLPSHRSAFQKYVPSPTLSSESSAASAVASASTALQPTDSNAAVRDYPLETESLPAIYQPNFTKPVSIRPANAWRNPQFDWKTIVWGK